MEEMKQVIGILLQEFVKEEAGNKITSNNIAGLSIKITAALDGQITLTQNDGAKSEKE